MTELGTNLEGVKGWGKHKLHSTVIEDLGDLSSGRQSICMIKINIKLL